MGAWETRGLTESFYKNMEEDQISTRARIVKMCLMHFTNAKGKNAYPSIERLRSMTALSKRSVRYALRELEQKRHLETHHKAGRANVYTIIAKEKKQDPSRNSRGNNDPSKTCVSTPAKSEQYPGKNCPRSVNDQVKTDQLDDKGGNASIAGVSAPEVSEPPPSSLPTSSSSPNPNPHKQNLRATKTNEVHKLATECQRLNDWKEPNLPTDDALRRVEQALDQFGLHECLRAVVGYQRHTKRTKSSYLDFWYAFPAVHRNNFQITNQLDVSRFKSFVRAGQGYKPPVAQSLVRPRAEQESDAESKRLDRYWQMHHRKALAEAKKQNQTSKESERYAKATADKETIEEIKRGSVY